MKDQTPKSGKTRRSAAGKAKGAALSFFGAAAVALASARPAYAVNVEGPSFNYMVQNYLGPGLTLFGFAILAIGGYTYFTHQDEDGPQAKVGVGMMVGGGIMAAIGSGAMMMLSMSA